MALLRVKVKTINPKKRFMSTTKKEYIFKFPQKHKKFIMLCSTIVIIKTATVCKTYFFQENATRLLTIRVGKRLACIDHSHRTPCFTPTTYLRSKYSNLKLTHAKNEFLPEK